jgi:hypothetical protein
METLKFGVFVCILKAGGKNMMDIPGWEWVVDTNEMTCRNPENAVTIKIEKKGDYFKGMIRDMPMGLFSEIAKYGDGERIIEEIVKTAEEEYLKAGQLAGIN